MSENETSVENMVTEAYNELHLTISDHLWSVGGTRYDDGNDYELIADTDALIADLMGQGWQFKKGDVVLGEG